MCVYAFIYIYIYIYIISIIYYLYMYTYIYINSNLSPGTNFTISSRSTKFEDILPWNIFQMIMKTVSISTRIVKIYAMKRDISF